MNSPLKEGIDFYWDDKGLMVLTREYLLKKGHCCQSGCRHCPYGHTQKVDPSVPMELQSSKNSEGEEIEIYDGEIPEDQE